jgi:cytochrome c
VKTAPRSIWLGLGLLCSSLLYAGINAVWTAHVPRQEADQAEVDQKAKGKLVAETCLSCHQLDQSTLFVGPPLGGVVGRRVASVEGYDYSTAMRGQSDRIWTKEDLIQFVQNPQAMVPGSKMVLSGISEESARALVAYLEEN